ncbi:MAG: hypothetical protein Q9166_005096 [cf. Caloplaca sp. 2 TL-2023]
MQASEQTIFMPTNELDFMNMSDVYDVGNFDCPDPSAFDWDMPQSVFEETQAPMADTMFDPSIGGMWQPMEPPGPSIDPALLTMSDPSLDPSTMPAAFAFTGNEVVFPPQSLDYFNPTSYAPFSPEVPTTAPTYPVSTFAEPKPISFRTIQPKAVVKESTKPRAPTSAPGNQKKLQRPKPKWGAWKKTDQPRVDGSGCWCSLCNGGKAIDPNNLIMMKAKSAAESALRTQETTLKNTKLWKDKAARAPAAASKPRVAKGRATKRKAREMTPGEVDESESELSSVPELDDESEEYRPTTKAVKSALTKRRKVGRKTAGKGKNMPKGLEINMNGW